MKNNVLQNILLGTLVALSSSFIILLYFYMNYNNSITQEKNYVVNWSKNKDNTKDFIPVFQRVEYNTEEEIVNQTNTHNRSQEWVTTDDSVLINYAQIPKDINTIWPVYSNWSISDITYEDKEAPNEIPEVYSSNAKTYMKYQSLGYESWNRQGHLCRQKEAYTGNHYIRMIDGRMLIALGQHYSSTIGTYIDIQLEDGTVLACILGDVKANKDTDSTKRYCIHDNSVLEFIVDSQGIDSKDYTKLKTLEPLGGAGNYSKIKELSSPVKIIRVYNKVYEINMSDLSNDNPDTNDTRR